MRAEQRWSAEHSRQFSEYGGNVRGYVRYEVTRHNLTQKLHGFLQYPRCVVDIGGGRGEDAKWLANLYPRHDVVLVEPDADSVAAARASSDTLEGIIEGDVRTAIAKYGQEHFELILLHGVLQYLPNPQEELRHLASLLQPGGYLSLLTAGKVGKINRFDAQGDQAAANELRRSGKYVNNLGVEAVAYSQREIESMLRRVGLITDTEGWFGVRLLSDDDNRRLDDVSTLELDQIRQLEIDASRDPAQKAAGQMLHFIARKNT